LEIKEQSEDEEIESERQQVSEEFADRAMFDLFARNGVLDNLDGTLCITLANLMLMAEIEITSEQVEAKISPEETTKIDWTAYKQIISKIKAGY
jgi:hypothetical protein